MPRQEQEPVFARRHFIKSSSAALTAGALSGPWVHSRRAKFSWRLLTSWQSDALPLLLEGSRRFADMVRTMSAGALDIEVFAADERVPALGVFDAVKAGAAEAFNSIPRYWADQVPAAALFSSFPFGFTYNELNAFLYHGGGLELWQQVYAEHGLVPIPIMTTGMQMGGWFNKPINTISDFQGLKMRMTTLGGRVLTKAGASVVYLLGPEILPALRSGQLDAVEWIGPYSDLLIGLPSAAKYYYHPGWHEPGTNCELTVRKEIWNALPEELQMIVGAAAADTTAWIWENFEVRNAQALPEIAGKYPQVEIRRFPDSVLADLQQLTLDVLEEGAAADPMFAAVKKAAQDFASELSGWDRISTASYLQARYGG
ncbi:MAG: TRAP transporter substrate-binding protein [Acidobacteria bacterium]|nr:TRAP transporter substrate-binding protein [Acidobacteriota bacterium]